MDKTTFLEELEKSLHVLKEEEIQDIIGEYEQHIDMKIKNGQTEEQAIADFGTVRELASEILEAYHVRADEESCNALDAQADDDADLKLNQKRLQERMNGLHAGFSKVSARLGEWFHQAGERIHRVCVWCKKQVLRPVVWIKQRKIRNETPKKERNLGERMNPAKKTERKRSDEMGIAKTIGAACRQFWSMIIAMMRWCIRIFWKGCLLGITGVIGIFELIAFYVEGVLVVLLVNGYPLTGVSVGGVGVILGLFAAIGVCWTFRNWKLQRIFIGILTVGVLLTGIGTGTALIEYSSFEYGGEMIVGREHLVTETLEYHLDTEIKNLRLEQRFPSYLLRNAELVEEAGLPERVIQYEITYNEEMVHPFLWEDDWNQNGKPREESLWLGIGLEYLSDDFVAFMEYKDQILDDLKQKKISSYRTNYVTNIVIKVNPVTREQIDIEFY